MKVWLLCFTWLAGAAVGTSIPGRLLASEPSLAALARQYRDVHRYSTLFTAQDVRNHLATEEGLIKAMNWCRATAITRVFLESFRSNERASREVLQRARDRFREEGFEVSGCVTTTLVGKRSTGWDLISCYTDIPTQNRIREIFEFTASLFDEIMIDDFWFTDCKCPECDAARQSRTVTIGDRTFPVPGGTWEDYYRELMVQLSRLYVIDAARHINPDVKIIIKYPQWYDRFHERGYDVVRETARFDKIWVGTETRDYDDPRWGGTVQYEAYFIMRWLGGLGGKKTGGGWFDWLGTTEKTYLEQARQTILGGARESMLFCYGGLQRDTGPDNIAALRKNLPELFGVAAEVRRRKPVGIAAYKPPNSHPENESRVFDFVGMLGLPLIPCHVFPEDAPAAFLSVHALKDPDLFPKLDHFLDAGKPVLLTDGLRDRLDAELLRDRVNVHILTMAGDPKSLLNRPEAELASLQAAMLRPFGVEWKAPAKVVLYLYADGSWVAENFRDAAAAVRYGRSEFVVPPRGWIRKWNSPASP